MSRYRKLRGLMIRSLNKDEKDLKENVDTNVTVTKSVFSLTCSNRDSSGLWNSSRFNLKFHFFKLDDNSASRIRRRGIQRSVWTGLRGSIGHGRQRVHVELHNVDISGCEGDRQRGVLYDIPEGDEFDLGERHYNRRTDPRTWDDQRSNHHSHAGHRPTNWRRRIWDILGGRGDPLPARGTDHLKAGRSDPAKLQSGVGDDRQRNDRE